MGPYDHSWMFGGGMLLGGLWHGAGWTFIIWGGLHGAYLIVNHLWDVLTKASPALSRAGCRWRASG